jgi:hypothetical protein
MFLKPKELKDYINTDGSGTDKFNSKVSELPKSYKLALYLGYSLKWDYDWDWEDRWKADVKIHTISPVFKKSHDKYDNWYFCWN